MKLDTELSVMLHNYKTSWLAERAGTGKRP